MHAETTGERLDVRCMPQHLKFESEEKKPIHRGIDRSLNLGSSARRLTDTSLQSAKHKDAEGLATPIPSPLISVFFVASIHPNIIAFVAHLRLHNP